MHIKSFKPGHKTTSLLSLVVLAALAAIGVSSCTCNPNLPAPADYKIRTRQIGTNQPIEKFTYYDDGRVKSKEAYGETRVYNYNPGNVTVATLGSSATLTMPLNAQGYISVDEDNNYARTYDAEGHLIKKELVDPLNTGLFPTYYTYNTDGNLAEGTTLVPGFSFKKSYEYYEKQDTRLDGLDWYYGKRSKNLVKEEKYNGVTVCHYSYDFDDRGRVIKELQDDPINQQILVTTYTYFN